MIENHWCSIVASGGHTVAQEGLFLDAANCRTRREVFIAAN